jgi:hypothetical protein
MVTMFRIFIVYQPLRFFLSVSLFPFGLGLIIGARFLWYFLKGGGSGHVQSLILAAVLLIVGFLTFLLAILGDLLSVNRRLLEELQQRERRRRIEAAFGSVAAIAGAGPRTSSLHPSTAEQRSSMANS